jgi:TolA-binding protein
LLIAFDFDIDTLPFSDRKKYQNWVQIMKDHFVVMEERVEELQTELQSLESQLDFFDTNKAIMADIEEEKAHESQRKAAACLLAAPEPLAFAPFSQANDSKGYNCHVITKHAVDCIVEADFANRRELMIAKMQGLPASVLKIDFAYKLARKIRVYISHGQSFALYKCTITIQNEDTLTIFWKALRTSESFVHLKAD